MTNFATLVLAGCLSLPLPAMAEVIGSDPQALIEQVGEDNKALLGPVIVSDSRLMLGGSGEVLSVSPIKELIYAGMSFGKVFEIKSGEPLDLEGHLVCDPKPSYVLVGKSTDASGNMGMRISFFDKDQGSALVNEQTSEACATSAFKTAEQIVAASEEEGSEQSAAPAASDGPESAGTGSGDEAGSWVVSEDRNPLDDSKTVVLSLVAYAGRNDYGQAPALYARCKSNTTEVYIAWGTYLGSGRTVQVVRMGKQPARSENWSISTDGKAVFSPGWGGDFLQRLEKVDTLTVQIEPYGDSPITAQFDVTGLEKVLPKISQTCNWK